MEMRIFGNSVFNLRRTIIVLSRSRAIEGVCIASMPVMALGQIDCEQFKVSVEERTQIVLDGPNSRALSKDEHVPVVFKWNNEIYLNCDDTCKTSVLTGVRPEWIRHIDVIRIKDVQPGLDKTDKNRFLLITIRDPSEIATNELLEIRSLLSECLKFACIQSGD